MFGRYLISIARLFRTNRAFTVINVLSLVIGISSALAIFQLVRYEFSFDTFEKGRNRIYRVVIDAEFNGKEGHSAGVPAPLFGAVRREVTGVEDAAPLMQFQGDATAKVSVPHGKDGALLFKKQPGIIFTDGGYFRLLPYQWEAGNPGLALQKPFTLVLTESRARQYFPDLKPREVIGKALSYNGISVTVTGIVRDLQTPTGFTAKEFISYPTIEATSLRDQFMMDVWDDWMAYSTLFVRLDPGTSAAAVDGTLNNLLAKYDKKAKSNPYQHFVFRLQPLKEVHFDNRYQAFGNRTASRPVLYGLCLVAAFLLLLGCINFVNLMTAQAMYRAREVGIRKTLGGTRKRLVLQFMTETLCLTLLAAVISIATAPLLLRAFRDFLPPGFSGGLQLYPDVVLFMPLLVLVVTLLAGAYPAFVLSAYRPALAFRQGHQGGEGGAGARRVLTVSQFVIAQCFVIGMIIVTKQIRYSLRSDMGFSAEAVINFETPSDTIPSHGQWLADRIKALPGVAMVSRGFLAPADQGVAFVNVAYDDGKEILRPQAQIRWGDTQYLKLYGIPLIAGRNIGPGDTIREFVVNESYVRAMGLKRPEDALGKRLDWQGKQVPIVGVMRDFHDQSTRAPISPLILGGSPGSIFHVKLAGGEAASDWTRTISRIGKAFHQLYPGEEFDYHFLDDTIASFYKTAEQTEVLLRWATGLCLLISCLGLLGLVIFTTARRTKEIGVRKVLGASPSRIVWVLSRESLSLIALAIFIAIPAGWWAGHRWLEGFAYRTPLTWWVFFLSGAAMMLVAFVTLCLQTLKASAANPVHALRTE